MVTWQLNIYRDNVSIALFELDIWNCSA